MRTTSLAPRPLAAERSPWLRGTLGVPGDPVIAHLALIVAAISRGESTIADAPETPDIEATIAALGALGVRFDRSGDRWQVSGLGIGGLLEPREPLDFGGSALGLELVAGLVGTHDFPVRLAAGPDLSSRGLLPLLEGLRRFGATFTSDDRGRPPLTLRGPRIATQIDHDLPRKAVPATKAALLFAALNALGTSRIVEPVAGWDHAEQLLAAAGVAIAVTPGEAGRTVEIGGLPDIAARQCVVPGDPALAALGAVAATIVPGSDIRIEGILVNPARTSILSALVAMGAAIAVRNLETVGGEQVADLVVRSASLRAVTLADHFVAPLVGDLPALAVAAAFAEGDTVLNLPASLDYDDRGRIAALARGLSVNGIACEATEEALVIAGAAQVPGGGTVVTAGDPGLAMAFLVLGMAAKDRVTIADATGIEERFPGFVGAFENVGASFIEDGDR